MATKKAAPKAADILEKKGSAAAKRRETLSIFFMEGEAFRIEGTPEVVEHLTLKLYAHDAQGTAHLADVIPEHKEDGAFAGMFPELYVKEDPETYAVCGVAIPERSYTQDEFFEWRDLANKYELAAGQAEMQRISIKLEKEFGNTVEVKNAKKRLPAYEKELQELIEQEAKDLYAFIEPQDGKPSGAEKLEIVTSRVKDLQAVIDQGAVDPITRLDKTSEDGQRYERLERVDREAHLEFVHMLATKQGLTTEPFEAWRGRATGDDFANAAELMNVGNDYWLYGKDAEPLSRKERRKLMREVSAALRQIAKAGMRN